MQQTFSIKRIKNKWIIVDNIDPNEIFDDGGKEGFTREEVITACINYNIVKETPEEEKLREQNQAQVEEELRKFGNLNFPSDKEYLSDSIVSELLTGSFPDKVDSSV